MKAQFLGIRNTEDVWNGSKKGEMLENEDEDVSRS
jgi:hypothetical protein